MVMDFDLNDPKELELAKLWTLAFLSTMRDGGLWVVPRSKSIYVIDQKTKTLFKLTGTPEPAIEQVCMLIGWKVELGPQEENII